MSAPAAVPAPGATPAPGSDDRPAVPRRRGGPFSRENIVSTITTGYVPLLLATAVVILPLAWMVISSF